MTTEISVLAHVMDKTRQLTLLYLDLLKAADPYKTFEVNGLKLNSIFWIRAHLAVTENFLLLRSIGGTPVKIPWARQFGLGSAISAEADCPPADEVNQVFHEVHNLALNHIRTLQDSYLDEVNPTGFTFAGENSCRSVIVHAIRHEGSHAGHLGWLCKLNGITTL